MNSLFFALFAAGFSALSSLLFRKNADAKKNSSPSGYLVIFYVISFIFSFGFYLENKNVTLNFVILGIGIVVGLLNSGLMMLTDQALKSGSAGLTFAFLNASAVFPGLLLFLLLGTNFGFAYTSAQFMGMVLVLLGLFLGAKKETNSVSQFSYKWLKYVLGCFILQIFALTCIQGRCILFDQNLKDILVFNEVDDYWFMPGLFGAASLHQIILFFRKHKKLQKSEIMYGSFGGIANFLSTALLLVATKNALPMEKGILFPIFAVLAMILCNFWAYLLYKEKFNFKTTALCSLGIFLAVS